VKYLTLKEMPTKLVSVSWMEDTEFSFIQKKVTKSINGKSERFFSNSSDKLFVNSYGDDTRISFQDPTDLHGSYFSHNGSIYYVGLGMKIALEKNAPEAVKAALGDLDTNKFFKDLFENISGKWRIYNVDGQLVATCLLDAKLVKTGIYNSGFYNDLYATETINDSRLLTDICPSKDIVIRHYVRLKKLAEKLGASLHQKLVQ